MTASELYKLSARQLAEEICGGRVTSRQAVEHFFDRIEKYDAKVGAYLSLHKQRSLERAGQIDEKIAKGEGAGLLGGVPIAIKDNMCTRFGATTCGSKILENFHAPYDAHVVEQLEKAGAVIIGKANLDEFAMGSSTENSSLGKTVNPWDFNRVPGGSSGGSAAAVSAGLCSMALGSDTGGSIRQPASFCSVVGIKPTYGRVSRYGLVAYGSSLDQIGPLTYCVDDAALMMNVIAGHDDRDSTSVSNKLAPVEDYLAGIENPVDGLRIAVVPEFIDGADESVQQATKAALEQYKAMGASVVEVAMPHFDYAVATYYVIATAEASSNLARFDGVHYGHRSKDAQDYVEVYSRSRKEGFGDEVKRRIMLGTYALSSGYYDAYYLKALKVRNLIRGDFEAALKYAHCLMLPVSPTTAFAIGEKMSDPLQMYLADIYTIALNLAGLPGLSLPCGFDSNGLGIGLQIVCPAFEEKRLFQIAKMYESKTDWHTMRPSLEGGK